MRRVSTEEASASGKTNKTMPVEREPSLVTLPRAWLLALGALIIIPWLVAGVIYFREPVKSAAPPGGASPKESSELPASPGPWGHLSTLPILISPPLEYIGSDWGRPSETDVWFFPGASPEVLEAFLSSTGLPPDHVSRLRRLSRPDSRTNGLVVTPPADIVRSMSSQVRARVYLELGKTQLNFDQANPFLFHASSVEAWLGGSAISPQTRQLVEPFIYSDGEFLLFADPEIIRSQVTDEKERRYLAKTLLRQPTSLVKLTIKDAGEVTGLAEYWGRGGRRTDLRPLLDSVFESAPGRSIDIIHLLPTFARNHLYRYPRLTGADLNRPLIANCLWSALNFFNNQPDDRFLDVNFALKTLRRDYFIVETNFQLGDIVVFVDSNGSLFHVATYLADNLVLSKNGTSPMAPWAITTIDQLKGFYRLRSSNPQLIYHRRNDM